MEEELKKLFLEFLSKTLKKDKAAVASLIYNDDESELRPDALDTLIQEQTTFIGTLKTGGKAKFDDGYKKGQKETMEKFEKEIKDQFDIDSDAQGLDLIKEIVTSVESAKGDGKPITDDEIKKHPLYLDLSKKLKKAEADKKAEIDAEVAKVKGEWNREKVLSKVKKAALELIEADKPIALSSDAEKAKTQRTKQDKLLLSELSDYNFELQGEGDDERIVVLKKDGTLLEDDLGHAIEFTALVKEKAGNIYDFQASEPRDNPPGNKKPGTGNPPPPPSGKKYVLKKPANYEEWSAQHEAIENDKELKPEEITKLQADLKVLYKGEPV